MAPLDEREVKTGELVPREHDRGTTYLDSETGMHVIREHDGTCIGIIAHEKDADRIVLAMNLLQMLEDYYPELIFPNVDTKSQDEYAKVLKDDIETVSSYDYTY